MMFHHFKLITRDGDGEKERGSGGFRWWFEIWKDEEELAASLGNAVRGF